MIGVSTKLATLVLVAAITVPISVSAANVFGGKVNPSIPCFNVATWNVVGPPRGGRFIFIPKVTRTYPFGAPGSGRWTLGLYGIPYFCIVSIAPLIVFPGISMTMEASSGPSAPSAPAPAPAPTPAPTPTAPSIPTWKYPQFTTAAQYEAEIARLNTAQQQCIALGVRTCTYAIQADAVAQEQQQRFGSP